MEAVLYLLFVLPALAAGSGDTLSSCKLCFSQTCTPTMRGISASTFDPPYDVEVLRAAIEGLGTDEYALSYILTSRSDSQRQVILDEYAKVKIHLLQDVKHDTSGAFRKSMVALVSTLVPYYTKELDRAIRDKDKLVMAEILSTLTPCMIRLVSNKYNELFDKDLDDELEKVKQQDVKNYTPADFAVAMERLAQGDREENAEADEGRAIADANRLMEARTRTEEGVFIDIFTKRSMPQLLETLKQYRILRGEDLFKDFASLEGDIKREFSSVALKDLYVTIAQNAFDQPLYFAWEIEKILKTFMKSGRDEYNIVRIVRGRSDIDMEEIKHAYHNQFGKSLAEAITTSFAINDFSKSLLDMLCEPHN